MNVTVAWLRGENIYYENYRGVDLVNHRDGCYTIVFAGNNRKIFVSDRHLLYIDTFEEDPPAQKAIGVL